MQETNLKLLASDGPCDITFRPMLTTVQYDELARLVLNGPSRSRRELCDCLAQLSAEWGVTFETDCESD